MSARTLAITAVVVATSWLAAGEALAYPQYQLGRDATCTGCHLSPAGGNLLNENGLALAESKSQLGTAPEFFYGKVPTPSWLTLGGDLRGTTGYIQSPSKVLTSFPMQIELYGAATFGQFSVHVNAGPRPQQVGNEGATSVWSREHYVMWQQKPGENAGLYVRLGRFMPVFGLRLAEHPVYTRRYGGTQLYGDTYGLHAAYISTKIEAHVTGFVADPLIDPVDHASGGAAYAELRLGEHAAVGAEGMVARTKDDTTARGGVTGKVFVPAANLVVQGEVQLASQLIDKSATNSIGGNPLRVIAYVLGSVTLAKPLLLDVGLGVYDSNLRFAKLDREAVDLNLHWFTTSHVELVWNNRLETLAFGKGGPAGAYSLLQLHYRL